MQFVWKTEDVKGGTRVVNLKSQVQWTIADGDCACSTFILVAGPGCIEKSVPMDAKQMAAVLNALEVVPAKLYAKIIREAAQGRVFDQLGRGPWRGAKKVIWNKPGL
jgi:hypothetical protein